MDALGSKHGFKVSGLYIDLLPGRQLSPYRKSELIYAKNQFLSYIMTYLLWNSTATIR